MMRNDDAVCASVLIRIYVILQVTHVNPSLDGNKVSRNEPVINQGKTLVR